MARAAADQDPKARRHEPAAAAAEPHEPTAEVDADFAEYDGDEEEEELDGPVAAAVERDRLQSVFRRLSSEPVGIRVRDVVIMGNTETRGELIEAEVADLLRAAQTMQDLIRAASVATARLQRLRVFDAVKITLDAGAPDLTGTTNVVIQVVEAANSLAYSVGTYSKPEAISRLLQEHSLKLKNLFGYGDIWDASGSYGWGQTPPEIGIGVYLPRFKSIAIPSMVRASFSPQDCLLGLWFGHNLLSALKYTYKIDKRDSLVSPTKGYEFQSTSQVGGLWDGKGLRFFRQEFAVHGAMPLGFYNATLNFGIGVDAILPLGERYTDHRSHVPGSFILCGHSSPVCSLSGLSSMLGFRSRGVGPIEARWLVPNESESGSAAASEMGCLRGHLSTSVFADFSFDLPSSQVIPRCWNSRTCIPRDWELGRVYQIKSLSAHSQELRWCWRHFTN
ncbi:unnamed protein product [Urochloa decumbens]|uniref:Bacterial surface antigen (D15) domain-containing protein n=1 Tax=Urochloa decumbens TaxID=240449 RepID=A0ABC9BKC3_9POAL